MDNDKFMALKAQGNEGEDFFKLRHNELLLHPVVPLLKMDDWNIEGSDIGGQRLLWKETILQDENDQYRTGKTPFLQYGGIEVKTLGEDQFLPRYGINDLECGTIGFPLWGGTEDKPDGGTGYCRDAYGNLKRWMEPSTENRGARPIILGHLLQTKDLDKFSGIEHERYFAAVMFEDVDLLLKRITHYLEKFGLDLNHWESISVGEDARALRKEGLYLQGNMVHIPLSELADLATVTMIGNDPVIYGTGRCSKAVQQARLDYLKELAGDRWIPQEKPADGVVTDPELLFLWHRKLVWGNARYKNQLTKQGEYMES